MSLRLRREVVKQAAAELFEEHRLAFREQLYPAAAGQEVPSSKMQNMLSGYLSRIRKREQ